LNSIQKLNKSRLSELQTQTPVYNERQTKLERVLEHRTNVSEGNLQLSRSA